MGLLIQQRSFSRTLKLKERTMTIEIRDASLEARIQKQLQASGSSSVEEVLFRLREASALIAGERHSDALR